MAFNGTLLMILYPVDDREARGKRDVAWACRRSEIQHETDARLDPGHGCGWQDGEMLV